MTIYCEILLVQETFYPIHSQLFLVLLERLCPNKKKENEKKKKKVKLNLL